MKHSELIIHADDAGMCLSVNNAIIEGLLNGCINSTSLMVPCQYFTHFVEFAIRQENQKYDYGIHLTFTSEWQDYRWKPVLPKSIVSSLIDKDGYFHKTNALFKEMADPVEVEKELFAQLDRAMETGVNFSHVDSHMFALFERPDLLQIYTKAGIKYGLTPQLSKQSFTQDSIFDNPAMDECISLLMKNDMRVPDDVLHFYWERDLEERRKVYLENLEALQPGTRNVLLIHPGTKNKELNAITSQPEILDQDRILFTDPAFIDVINRLNINTTTWANFRG